MKHLDEAHASIATSLLALEALAERAAARAPDGRDAAAARRILDCFDRTALEHHREEELQIFPALRARAAAERRPELGAALYELEMEHRRMEEIYALLRPGLERIAGGKAATLSPESIAFFTAVYRRHMRIEADVLAPFAEEAG